MRKPSTAEATAERLSVKNTPHKTNSIEIPKETPNTPGFIVEPIDLRIVIHPSLRTSFNKHRASQRVIGCDRMPQQKRNGPRSGRRPMSEAAQKRWRTYYPDCAVVTPIISKICLR